MAINPAFFVLVKKNLASLTKLKGQGQKRGKEKKYEVALHFNSRALKHRN